MRDVGMTEVNALRGWLHGGHGPDDGPHRGPGPRGERGGPHARFRYGRRGGFPPPWPGGPGGPRGWPGEPGFSRGPRVRRGDVRAAILALLAEEPRNGYQIIQEISHRSGGVWHPSPGSVYPALSQLEDEGMIATETPGGGRKRFTLTAEGRDYVADHPGEAEAPWDVVASSVSSSARELHGLIGEVAAAAAQVVHVGGSAQVLRAHAILAETRRGLYRLLAADEDDSGEGEE